MKKYMRYGFKNLIVDNELAQKVVSSPKCKISELVESGFGVCRHLSPLYLYFATEAGLSGVLQMTVMQNDFVNVYRDIDKKSKLFQSKEVGQSIGGHMWANIKVAEEWILVDPSVSLVGDNEFNKSIIEQANYKSRLEAPKIHNEELSNINTYGQPIFNPVSNTGKAAEIKIFVKNNDLVEQKRFGTPNLPPKANKFRGVVSCEVETESIFGGTKLEATE